MKQLPAVLESLVARIQKVWKTHGKKHYKQIFNDMSQNFSPQKQPPVRWATKASFNHILGESEG